jgi:hypothetical protein
MLDKGEGILQNKSLTSHYYKLSANQGNADCQLHYGVMLDNDEGVLMNKSLACHYYYYYYYQLIKAMRRVNVIMVLSFRTAKVFCKTNHLPVIIINDQPIKDMLMPNGVMQTVYSLELALR